MVNPRPVTSRSTPGIPRRMSRSPLFHWPLMNCKKKTRIRLPAARTTSPIAAVVLPLPLPVYTMVSPCRPRRSAAPYSLRSTLLVGFESVTILGHFQRTAWREWCVEDRRVEHARQHLDPINQPRARPAEQMGVAGVDASIAHRWQAVPAR